MRAIDFSRRPRDGAAARPASKNGSGTLTGPPAVARESATADTQNSEWVACCGFRAVCVAFHAAEPKT